jgi:hypothetical protein
MSTDTETRSNTPLQPTIAVTGHRVVRCSGTLRCECGHRLRAYEIDILPDGSTRAVCWQCHRDGFAVER